MIYIHDSDIVSHGRLKSSNCLVDNRWVLQITGFGLHELRSVREISSKITTQYLEIADSGYLLNHSLSIIILDFFILFFFSCFKAISLPSSRNFKKSSRFSKRLTKRRCLFLFHHSLRNGWSKRSLGSNLFKTSTHSWTCNISKSLQ